MMYVCQYICNLKKGMEALPSTGLNTLAAFDEQMK